MKSGPQILVFPAWQDNPFLNLLELFPRSQGYAFVGATGFDALLDRLAELGDREALHLHWTTPILQNARSETEAGDRLVRFERTLRAAKQRGVRLIWTLHNRLPHELSYRDLEIRLTRLVADLADLIHVMAPDTAEVVADVVTLDPAKTRVIPHPSYAGIYDSAIARPVARDSFGLGASDLAVLFLGQIRPYKGVDALIEAIGSAERPGRELVLMLGGVVKDVPLDDFLETLPEGVRTISHFEFVPDGQLARWFTAADVAVLPYRAILNSGSLHLAATFRVPVVLPDEPHLRSQFGTLPWVAFFDRERPAETIAELLSDPDLFSGVVAADFDRFNAPISPWKVSRRYGLLLDEALGSA